FVLSHCASYQPRPEPIDPLKALEITVQSWNVSQQDFNLAGTPYADEVLRSLITLKGLTYPLTGGVVAAPTTSLPEKIGGVRNWDYRYCWLRDATFTLLALLNSGFRDEASAFRLWLQRAVGGSPQQMQIVYGLGGERRLIECEIPWLSGFRNS